MDASLNQPCRVQEDGSMSCKLLLYEGKLNAKGIALNRKVLADLAMNEPKAFEAIVKAVK